MVPQGLLFETSSVILYSPARDKGLTVTCYWLALPQLNKAMGILDRHEKLKGFKCESFASFTHVPFLI